MKKVKKTSWLRKTLLHLNLQRAGYRCSAAATPSKYHSIVASNASMLCDTNSAPLLLCTSRRSQCFLVCRWPAVCQKYRQCYGVRCRYYHDGGSRAGMGTAYLARRQLQVYDHAPAQRRLSKLEYQACLASAAPVTLRENGNCASLREFCQERKRIDSPFH